MRNKLSVWFQWAGVDTENVNFLTAKGLENMELHTGGGGVGVNGLRFIPAGPNTYVDAANVITTGWNHVAATYDGSAAYLYVNGVLVGSHTGITGGNDLTLDNTPFSVGQRSGGSYRFAGVIDEVRVYNRVLSEAEIATLAGSLDSPGAPTTTAGHMPTLQELYGYLTTGAAPGTAQSFQEPATGPTATMKTLQQIYVALKTRFDQITVDAADVLSGTKYFSTSPWGIQSGAMPDNGAVSITPGTAAQTIAAGYHNGSGTVAGDADLAAGNIKQGVNLFGVDGSYTGVTCSGTLNGTRWCDNGNGTVTDMTTGLVWLKKADWGDRYAFWVNTAAGTNAHDRAASLKAGATNADLSDGSVEGDWRLPTKTELSGLANGTEPVRSDNMRAFTGVRWDYYWTSTTTADYPSNAWGVKLYDGDVSYGDKTALPYVWPVRGGQ